MYLAKTFELMKEYDYTIRQIIANSDNEKDDMLGEAYLVVYANYDNIMVDSRFFINKLKKNCLRFNKYGKRIESKAVWCKFNDREESMMKNERKNNMDIDENFMVDFHVAKQCISDDDYDFLIHYYTNSCRETAKAYGIKEATIRTRVRRILEKVREKVAE